MDNYVRFIFCGILTFLVHGITILQAQDLFSTKGTIVELTNEDNFGNELSPSYQLRDIYGARYFLVGSEADHLDVLNGRFVEVSGVLLSESQLLLVTIEEKNLPLTQAVTFSSQRRVLIIRVNFSGAQVPCDKEWVARVMWNGERSVNGLYQASSFGGFSWTHDADNNNQDDVFETNIGEAVPSTCNWTLLYHWRSLALQSAIAQGVPVNIYEHVVYLLPNEVACGIGHAESSGCGSNCSAFLKLCSWPDLYAHELAHNLGLHHARTDFNNDAIPDSEYGDYSCPMGYSTVGYRHFNALHKRYMNWITASGEVEAQSTQTMYVLANEKNPNSTDLAYGSTQLVRIGVPGIPYSYYYVSYREPLDSYSEKLSDPWRVHIYRDVEGSPYSDLISTIGVGQTFSDGRGVQVRFDKRLSPYASILVHLGPASEIPTPVPETTPTPNFTPTSGSTPQPGTTPTPSMLQRVTFRVLADRVSYKKISLRLMRIASREVGTFKMNREFLSTRELEPGTYQVNAIGPGLKSSKATFTVAQEPLEILVKVKRQ